MAVVITTQPGNAPPGTCDLLDASHRGSRALLSSLVWGPLSSSSKGEGCCFRVEVCGGFTEKQPPLCLWAKGPCRQGLRVFRGQPDTRPVLPSCTVREFPIRKAWCCLCFVASVQAEGSQRLWSSEPCIRAPLSHDRCPCLPSPLPVASYASQSVSCRLRLHYLLSPFHSVSSLSLVPPPALYTGFVLSSTAPAPTFLGLQLPGKQSKWSDSFQVITFNCASWKAPGLGVETHRARGQARGRACTGPLCVSLTRPSFSEPGTRFPSYPLVRAVLLLKLEIPSMEGSLLNIWLIFLSEKTRVLALGERSGGFPQVTQLRRGQAGLPTTQQERSRIGQRPLLKRGRALFLLETQKLSSCGQNHSTDDRTLLASGPVLTGLRALVCFLI